MKIPEFTRTVLPNTSVGSAAISVARAPYDQAAKDFGNIQSVVQQAERLGADYALRQAEADNTTWVNENVVAYKKAMVDEMDAQRKARQLQPDNFHRDFDLAMEKRADDFLKAAPSEAARTAFKNTALSVRGSVYEENLRWERERKVEIFASRVDKTASDLEQMAYRAGQRGVSVKDLYRDADASAVAGSTFVAPEKVDQIRETMRQKIAEAEAAGMVESRPEDFIRLASRGRFSSAQGTFEDTMAFVEEEEGGFVANDGGKGPTLYGVNSDANPAEYAEIKDLYDEGRVQDAKAYAKQTLKQNYWDKIGADKMEPNFAMIATDAAINQGVGAAKAMIEKADGDPQKLLQLRRERYEQTAKIPGKEQYLKTWLRRLDKLAQEIQSPGLPPDKVQQYKRQAEATVRVQVSDEIQDVETAAKMGLEVEDGKIDDLIRKTSAVGMQREADSLRDFQSMQPEIKRFAAQSFSDQGAELQAMKDAIQGGDLSQAKKYQTFSTILDNKKSMIQKGDALGYYAAHKIVREPQPMDFGNPEVMAKELGQRRIAAQQIREMDGVQVSLLTSNEISYLKQIYETADPAQMTAVVTSMAQSMNQQEVAAISRAIAPESSTLAVAMASRNQQVAQRIFSGTKLKGDVSKSDVRSRLNEMIDGVIFDPAQMEPMQDAIYAYYKQLSFMSGSVSDSVDEDMLRKSLTDIMGPIVEIDTKTGFGGESKVLSYRDETTGAWKDEDAINDILLGITDEQLIAVNGSLPIAYDSGGKKFTTDVILDKARFISYGDGVYAALINDAEYLADEKGEVYKFDARALEAKQRGKK